MIIHRFQFSRHLIVPYKMTKQQNFQCIRSSLTGYIKSSIRDSLQMTYALIELHQPDTAFLPIASILCLTTYKIRVRYTVFCEILCLKYGSTSISTFLANLCSRTVNWIQMTDLPWKFYLQSCSASVHLYCQEEHTTHRRNGIPHVH